MTYEDILYQVDDGVATITLHRPEALNAFTFRMATELVDAFDRIDADDDVRAVVVTGAGRGFCAGADLSSGGDTFDIAAHGGPAAAEEHRDSGGAVVLRIVESRKPVIAAINGPAVGVGVTMTLPMDVRLASEAAKFGFVFARRGIVPDACSSWFLPRVVGISQAQEWMLTGRVFGPSEALEGGLVRAVHPPEELLPAAYALAHEMSDLTSPVSVALIRRLLWRGLGFADPNDAHVVESRLLYERGRSADVREGVEAFLAKRPPRFPMRVSTDLPDLEVSP
ncbi:MAG TPA: crotonase/enoyl-CoA hydratase family protein [Acidimicrobiales bacterium]|nr:crotonase/enoyl-CoA hydratase family protein [Acidimicrobiales bacterium]